MITHTPRHARTTALFLACMIQVGIATPGIAIAQTVETVCKNELDDDQDGWTDMKDIGCKDAYDQSETNDMRMSLTVLGRADVVTPATYALPFTVKNHERRRTIRGLTVSITLPTGFSLMSGDGCLTNTDTGTVDCGPYADIVPTASISRTLAISVASTVPCGGTVTIGLLAHDLGDVGWKSTQKTLDVRCRSSSSAQASVAASVTASSAHSPSQTSSAVESTSSMQQSSSSASSSPSTASEPTSAFTDIDAFSRIGTAANQLATLGIIRGYDDGTFRPDALVNRAEAAKFFVIARFGSALAPGNASFVDTDQGAWYMPYVGTAAAYGIIRGHPDGSFKPADHVNTAEFLKMLTLTFDLPEGLAHSYPDVAADAWFAPYAGIAQTYGLFPERGTSLEPGRAMTRGEVAFAIANILSR